MKKYLVLILGVLFVCLCGCSVRAGYGPYDTADYTDLDARREIMEDKEDFPSADEYWDAFDDELDATEAYSEYIGELVYQQYEMEQHATEDAARFYPTVITPFTPLF